jgi:hypothetical protein
MAKSPHHLLIDWVSFLRHLIPEVCQHSADLNGGGPGSYGRAKGRQSTNW